ncbi:MAG: DUF3137 domain-containing protein [Pseudomonadota bacterium]
MSDLSPARRGTADDVFTRHLLPVVAKLERDRLTALSAIKQRVILTVPLTIALWAAIVFLLVSFEARSAYVIALGVAVATGASIAAWTYCMLPSGRFADQLRETILGGVCSHLGNARYTRRPDDNAFDLSAFRDVHLVPSYTTASLEDQISGTHRGSTFTLLEARLRKRKRTGKSSSMRTVFTGLLCRIQMPRRISANVLIVADQGGWGSWVRSVSAWMTPGERVEIKHAAFEAKYDVFSTDPRIVRDVITPEFIDNFLRLPAILKTDKVLAAFSGDVFCISAAETPAFLDGFSVKRPVIDMREELGALIDEVMLVHRLIDLLLAGDRYARHD